MHRPSLLVMHDLSKNFPVGSLVEARDLSSGMWCKAKIVVLDWKTERILIHYENPFKNEWMPASQWNSRLKPKFSENPEHKSSFQYFDIGDHVIVTSFCGYKDGREVEEKYHGLIEKILPYGLYEVRRSRELVAIVVYFEMTHFNDCAHQSSEKEEVVGPSPRNSVEENNACTFKIGDIVLVTSCITDEKFYAVVESNLKNGLYKVQRFSGEETFTVDFEMINVSGGNSGKIFELQPAIIRNALSSNMILENSKKNDPTSRFRSLNETNSMRTKTMGKKRKYQSNEVKGTSSDTARPCAKKCSTEAIA